MHHLPCNKNALNTKLISLMILCRLVPLSFTCFSTSARVGTGNLIHSFLHKFFAGSWPWPHPLITKCVNSQGPPSKEHSSRLRVARKPEMEPLQGERTIFYVRLYKKAEERAIQCWPGPFYSQLQQPLCTVSQSSAPTHLPHNISSKRIAPNNNMRPNFNDDYSHHS